MHDLERKWAPILYPFGSVGFGIWDLDRKCKRLGVESRGSHTFSQYRGDSEREHRESGLIHFADQVHRCLSILIVIERKPCPRFLLAVQWY